MKYSEKRFPDISRETFNACLKMLYVFHPEECVRRGRAEAWGCALGGYALKEKNGYPPLSVVFSKVCLYTSVWSSAELRKKCISSPNI